MREGNGTRRQFGKALGMATAGAFAALVRGTELRRAVPILHSARWDASFDAKGARVAVIDDLADRRHDCDLLIDQNLGRRASDYAGRTPAGCRLLIGPQYALLRPEFAALRAALEVGADAKFIDLTFPEMVVAGRQGDLAHW